MARRTESTSLAGIHKQALFPTVGTPDAGKPPHGIAAVEILLDHLLNHRTEIAIPLACFIEKSGYFSLLEAPKVRTIQVGRMDTISFRSSLRPFFIKNLMVPWVQVIPYEMNTVAGINTHGRSIGFQRSPC